MTVTAPPAPTVTIGVSPASITLGQSATLTWSTANATACTASGAWSGSEGTSGTMSVTPTAAGSFGYVLTCTGAGGSGNSTATLTVTAAMPTVTVGVSPASITLGQSATLTWSSTNATACTASGSWSGSEATSGTLSVTFAEYIPVVSALVSDGCRRAYGSYWNRVTEQWGSRRIDEPTPSEIRQLVQHVRANVVPRRNSLGGRSAAEHLIAALRCMYKHAEEDGLIDVSASPAPGVAKPRRLPSTRRALTPHELEEINTRRRPPAMTSSSTPSCCACTPRPPAAAAARWPCGCVDLDRQRPRPPDRERRHRTVAAHHPRPRRTPLTTPTPGAPSAHRRPLLRYHNGQPISSRRYDHLWKRLGEPALGRRTGHHHPLATAHHPHLGRRHFGYGVARAYAGHTDNGSDTGATATYVRATTHGAGPPPVDRPGCRQREGGPWLTPHLARMQSQAEADLAAPGVEGRHWKTRPVPHRRPDSLLAVRRGGPPIYQNPRHGSIQPGRARRRILSRAASARRGSASPSEGP